MTDLQRRRFLQLATASGGAVAVSGILPPVIQRALAAPASSPTGSIRDVQHVVILMLENRSFDHYFGTLRGVRGFRDRHTVPLASGKPVWQQSDGTREIAPFHLDTHKSNALRAGGTPHTFENAQGAWDQGRLGHWPKFKTPLSMGHYQRDDLPFQFALAEAFTLCDAHHCSITTGTDPNRIMQFSGSNHDPRKRDRGEKCTAADAEVNNLRCLVSGTMPTPGYTYQGSAFDWPTLPEVLQQAGISWRLYQDPNDNWQGLMHGGLAFASFRSAMRDSPLYQQGMSHWSLQQLAQDAGSGQLPAVSWILPPMLWSEHPSPSSSIQGAEFTSRVLEALTANPDTWSKTALFVTFDENDGLFDHAPPPAPPSYNSDGTLAGKSTVDVNGLYFSDPEGKYLHPDDRLNGTVRPWGLGPRVPLYVVSPWSRGGWVNSQVFDHTSIAQFLEKRFDVHVPAISRWHRAVCGDLTSAFDFVTPNEPAFPALPWVRDSAAALAGARELPKVQIPQVPEPLFQESGVRHSRALPYELHVHSSGGRDPDRVILRLQNSGKMGAVLHVYDRLHLERIPRRYTLEAGKSLQDEWHPPYDLWVYGPNGFVREFRGPAAGSELHVRLDYERDTGAARIVIENNGQQPRVVALRANAYDAPVRASLTVNPGRRQTLSQLLTNSHNWYDLSVTAGEYEWRFAGRLEDGADGFSDPAV